MRDGNVLPPTCPGHGDLRSSCPSHDLGGFNNVMDGNLSLTRRGYARVAGSDTLGVRRAVVLLPERYVRRLPPSVQRPHTLAVARLAARVRARSAS